MAKTRSQTVIKKEEEEDHKDIQLLHSVNNTTGTSSKITKRKASRSKNNLPARQVKVEEEIDTKLLLQSGSKYPKAPKRQPISQEQINQLIHYVVNDKMSVLKASKKANVSYDKARHYYNTYKNDPEKKIPVPKYNRNICTRERTTTLITSIVDDDMTILEAPAKANMYYDTGHIYYKKYKENQNLNIRMKSGHKLMQQRVNKLIGYLADGKMTIKDASAKANIGYGNARKYYHKYLNDPNHDIPVVNPQSYCVAFPAQDQINKLISYIVTDKMSVSAAAKKAKLPKTTASQYYRIYKNDPNHRIPVAYNGKSGRNSIPQDRIKQLIRYITEDKMTITAASRKTNMSIISGSRYYQKYRNDPSSIITTSQSTICTQEQISKLISFIVNDKMTVKDASAKANMSLETGERYYQQYLIDLHYDAPTHLVSYQRVSEEQVNTFIRYVVHDKMSISAAAIKTNMSPWTGGKYYKQYISNPNNVIPTHIVYRPPPTQEQVTDLIRYIFEDKMSVYAASKKAKMGRVAASKYYHQYINDTNSEAPTHLRKGIPCKQEKIDNLIHYIVEDKMSISAASKKANMCRDSGSKYYNQYLKNLQLSPPTHSVL